MPIPIFSPPSSPRWASGPRFGCIELVQDIENLEFQLQNLKLRGAKGTTGTQASFLDLFEGDEEKVKKLEQLIATDMGFEACVAVSGQTYSRKTDSYFLSVLSGFAQSAYKFSNDLRLLQSFEEMEEPFEKNQIGSSAMPYKRNPMRSERISSLARYVIVDALNPALTAGTQWFERTLDDSANKRISVAEAFLAVDAILNIYINVTGGLVVYDKVVTRRVMEKLPFMATENIMMESVKRGGNRQELHERLRVHSHAAAAKVKLEGGTNDLIERIANDSAFPLSQRGAGAGAGPPKVHRQKRIPGGRVFGRGRGAHFAEVLQRAKSPAELTVYGKGVLSMKEFELKYGCNPNQKPAKIFMQSGGDLPIQVLNGTAWVISTSSTRLTPGSWSRS